MWRDLGENVVKKRQNKGCRVAILLSLCVCAHTHTLKGPGGWMSEVTWSFFLFSPHKHTHILSHTVALRCASSSSSPPPPTFFFFWCLLSAGCPLRPDTVAASSFLSGQHVSEPGVTSVYFYLLRTFLELQSEDFDIPSSV